MAPVSNLFMTKYCQFIKSSAYETWRRGVAYAGRDQRSYSTPGPVSTWMGERLPTGKPSLYVTSHPGQLSLSIPPWVGAMSTSESWGVNGHTARYTSPVSVVSQCKLVSGWGLRKRRSAPPYHGLVAREGLYTLLALWKLQFPISKDTSKWFTTRMPWVTTCWTIVTCLLQMVKLIHKDLYPVRSDYKHHDNNRRSQESLVKSGRTQTCTNFSMYKLSPYTNNCIRLAKLPTAYALCFCVHA